MFVAAALAWPVPASAGPRKISPEKTEELRVAARTKADAAGGLVEQADVLYRSGQDLGDPILMLDGAERLKMQADQERSTEIAHTAVEQVATALDVVSYMSDADAYGNTRWHPVAPESVSDVRSRAELLRDELSSLIDEIEAERAAALAAANKKPEPEEKKKRGPAKPGTGLIAGGAVSLGVLGGGGIGLAAFGLAQGADTQKQAEALNLPAELDQLDELDKQGARYNTFAIVGGVVAAVGVGLGVGLIVAGVKKRRASSDSPAEEEAASVVLVPGVRGVTLVGRF